MNDLDRYLVAYRATLKTGDDFLIGLIKKKIIEEYGIIPFNGVPPRRRPPCGEGLEPLEHLPLTIEAL